jgi:D-beta-D-heptose 7-phosphate kinase / D-beta-D-heptose 1-phosphate adenosyltransferase
MINLKNKSPNLLVIGDLMIDQYFWGESKRISPEAPVQIINIDTESMVLGGAGNVINNLRAMGANVDVLSVIGNDKNAAILKDLLKAINVKTDYLVKEDNRITSKKSRVIASQQQVVRYDRESLEEISKPSQKTVLATFNKIINNYDVILISDYGKGVLSNELTELIIKYASQNNKRVLIDPKGYDYSKYKGAYLLTPNIKEASAATNIKIVDDESLLKAITQLKSNYQLEVSIVTLSEKGIAIYDKDFRRYPTASKEVFDVTGAGDTVLASLGFSIACDLSIDQAVKFANLAAGVVVGKIGSATASLNEIIEYESSLNKSLSTVHIKTLEEITNLSQDLKTRGKDIVFTNGCFDLLHAGHVRYLEEAKGYGDVLIIGLNSNRSVSRLKGPKRPINSEEDRAYILAALEVVDYVVIFDEDTPYNLIQKIKPKILVKGSDYKGKEVVGQDIVDELILVDLYKGKSSSKTIKKIKQGD